MDKRLLILRCVEVDKSKTLDDLYHDTGMKNFKKFCLLVDELGTDHYLKHDGGDKVSLRTYSQTIRYKRERSIRRLSVIAAIAAICTIISTVFTALQFFR